MDTPVEKVEILAGQAERIIPFTYSGKQVRAFLDESGDPHFVAKDACDLLGLENPRSSLALLDDDEKGVCIVDTPGGPQKMATVTEPGLYKLIMKSRKPEAKRIVRWLCHDVMPALRKTGTYTVPGRETPAHMPAMDSALTLEMAGQLARLEDRLRRAEWKMRKASMDQYCLFGPCPNTARQQAKALPQGGELEVEPGRRLRYMRDADGKLWFSALDAVLLVYKNWTRGVIMRRIPARLRAMKLFPWCKNGFGAHALSAEGVIYLFENCPHKAAKKILGWFRNNFLPALA